MLTEFVDYSLNSSTKQKQQNSMSLMSEVTIIIPTHNRAKYLRRCLAFYEPYSAHVKIVVVDTSSDKASAQVCDSYPDIRYEALPSNISFSAKLARAADFVDTPYVVICSDDDFIFVEALQEAAKFLTHNPDHSCVHGKYLRHWFDANGALHFGECYGAKYPSLLNSELSQTDRLYFHFADYVPTFYALTRIDVFRFIYTTTEQAKVGYGLCELLPSALSVIAGKIARLPIIYACREAHDHDWTTPERNKSMYSVSRVELALSIIKSHIDDITEQEASLVDKLIVPEQGLPKLELSKELIDLAQSRRHLYKLTQRLNEDEMAWAKQQVSGTLLKYDSYNREQMIKIRETEYVSESSEVMP